MKYYLFETAPWETFYSAAAETTETIVNEFVSAYADYTKAEKFDKTKHQPAKHMSGVKNDEKKERKRSILCRGGNTCLFLPAGIVVG